MYIVTKKQVRPNQTVDFFNISSPLISLEAKEYYKNNYKLTGKLVYVDVGLSDDGLTQTASMMWESKQVYDEFMADPIIGAQIRDISDEYRIANGITTELVSTEEI